jgi:hypothetical protein
VELEDVLNWTAMSPTPPICVALAAHEIIGSNGNRRFRRQEGDVALVAKAIGVGPAVAMKVGWGTVK